MAVTETETVKFHRMYVPKRGTKVVLVDDIVFTGTAVALVLGYLRDCGLDVQGVSVWINRGDDTIAGARVISLAESPFEACPQGQCPLCRQGIPVLYRGIRE